MTKDRFILTADTAVRISSSVFTVILVLNIVAYEWFLYWRFHAFDMVMHTLGGFALGFLYLFLLLQKNKNGVIKFSKSIIFISVLSFAVLGGAVWELSEYILKSSTLFPSFFNKARFLGDTALKNTMSDLFFDILGGSVAGLFSMLGVGYNKETGDS